MSESYSFENDSNTMKKFYLITLIYVPVLFYAQSTVTFQIPYMGSSVEGKFERFTLDIQWNSSNPTTSVVSGIVYAESINTGIALRDRHLKSSSYFHISKFPEISFTSTKIEKTESQRVYKITGLLSIKGIKKEHTFTMTITPDGRKEFTTKLNRRDFNVGGWSLTMGDEVNIKVVE